MRSSCVAITGVSRICSDKARELWAVRGRSRIGGVGTAVDETGSIDAAVDGTGSIDAAGDGTGGIDTARSVLMAAESELRAAYTRVGSF